MEKEQLLNELKAMSAAGLVSRDEILAVMAVNHESTNVNRHLGLSEILYYIGSAIVFLGIFVLCYENWATFNSPLKIFITLGSCVASFIVAAVFSRYENFKKPAQAFFLLFGLLAPLALGVTLNEAGFDLSSSPLWVGVYVALTAIFFAAYWYFKQQEILLFFSIVFATLLFHFFVSWMAGESLTGADYSKVWEYQVLVIGLTYMLVGYFLSQTTHKALVGALYGFGSLFFLGSAIFLGGWLPNQNMFWELINPLLVFGIIFLSVVVKSRAFLVFGTIFLIALILKFTGEYFTSGLGWPLSLVIAGLLIMLVGYYAVRINKKYLVTPVIN